MWTDVSLSFEQFVAHSLSTDISVMYFIVYLFTVFVLLSFLIVFTKVLLSRLEINNITSRAVFVTGCDSGFGNLLAKSLDSKGVRVFAGCLTSKGAELLKSETSCRLKTVQVDVTDKESVERAYNVVKCDVGQDGLWGLVNNAGVMPTFCPFEWTDVDTFTQTCKVNLLGTISVTLQFLPLLRKTGGRLVNMCSVTANCPYPGITNYAVSKAAAKTFTACMRRELINTGVTAHTIEPGGFKTNLTDHDQLVDVFKKTFKRVSPDLQEYYGGNIGRYILKYLRLIPGYVSGTPQDVADAMAHALLAKYPKRQYLVGKDTTFFFGVMGLLPEWVGDYILGWPQPYGEMAAELKA